MGVFDILCQSDPINSVVGSTVSFRHIRYPKGEINILTQLKRHYVVFIISGRMQITFNEFENLKFGAGSMIFLSCGSYCEGSTLDELDLLVLSYDNPTAACDQTHLRQLMAHKERLTYRFESLKVCKPLDQFLQNVISYIDNGIDCKQIHEIKQKEFFIIFKHYYSLKEQAMFLYHSLSKDMDFRSIVMCNYLKAKNSEELARICGYSVKSFHRLFKQNFNQSPYQWMLQMTASHIKGRLIDQTIPLKAIVAEFGFASPSHFNTYCKRYLGDTPMQIRERSNR